MCQEHETQILTRVDAANNPNWYNHHNGGKKFSTTGKTMSLASRKKSSLSKKGKLLGPQSAEAKQERSK